MFKIIMTSSNARKNFYQLLKDVNQNHTEVQIISERNENNAVLISLNDWKSIQETLLLQQTGVIDQVDNAEKTILALPI